MNSATNRDLGVTIKSAERRAPSAERRAPSAERRAPSAERRAPSASCVRDPRSRLLLLAALIVGALCAFPERSAQAQAQAAVWSATLTADVIAQGGGCNDVSSALENCSSALSNNTFIYQGAVYRVLGVSFSQSTRSVTLIFDNAIPTQLVSSGTLHVGNVSFALSGLYRVLSPRGAGYERTGVDTPGWTDGQKVSVVLMAPASPASSVTVHGVTLAKFKAIPGDDRIELRWSKRSYNFCGYEVEWREGSTGAWQSYEYRTMGGTRTTITGLKPGTSYQVRLKVKSGYTNVAAGLAYMTTVMTTGTAPSMAPPVTAPALEWARVNGAELALRFDAALDGTSVPAASAFAVSVAGAARSVSGVAVSGDLVTLTLASAVSAGETVTVGYTPPSTGKLRRAGGGDVAAFSGQAVTNDTPTAGEPQQQPPPEAVEPPPAPAPLTARFSNAPSEHRGKGKFALRVAFSEAVTARRRTRAFR